MAFLAFMYDDYYCYGIKQSFKGIFSDLDEAKNQLKGDRYENQNLEVLDTDTCAFHQFRWCPYWIYESSYWYSEKKDGKTVPISLERFEHMQKNGNYDLVKLETKCWLIERYPGYGNEPRIIQDMDKDYELFFNTGYWSTDLELSE